MDDEEELQAFVRYKEMAAALPTSSGGILITNYRGYWFPAQLAAATVAIHHTFVPRPSDIILASYPKSGTTWLKALIFAVITRDRHPPDDPGHPLLHRSPHDCFPFLHTLYEGNSVPTGLLQSMPSPRLLALHIPLSCLPDSVVESSCRIVYVCREPKDAVVSNWHYNNKLFPQRGVQMEEYVDSVCAGKSGHGPIWNHLLEFWNASRARPEQVMFVKYEDVLQDTARHVEKMAEFLGYPFSDGEKGTGVVDQIVALCSFDRMSNYEVNLSGEHGVAVKFKNSAFFRCGKVGDWRRHLTDDMARRIDAVMEEKLRGSGLAFQGHAGA